MVETTRIVSPGRAPGTVRGADGEVLTPPAQWALLPPGDALATRRVKKAGPTWTVQQKRGRKVFSQGLWADAATIEAIRVEVAAERESPEYARKLAASRARAARKQADYVVEFRRAVLAFLDFAPAHDATARQLAGAVAEHGVAVGSGTVARTRRIPVGDRAEAAVIAWMRHATTAYDHMHIPRVKGRRREVRRTLAARSRHLLDRYRGGGAIPADCPLQRALCVQKESQPIHAPADRSKPRGGWARE